MEKVRTTKSNSTICMNLWNHIYSELTFCSCMTSCANPAFQKQ